MYINEWLKQAQASLEKSEIVTARLDALVLLEDVTKKDRAWLLVHSDEKLSTAQVNKLDNLLNQRCAHEPLAYIRGKTEFYGRSFVITKGVLEPRPETETMIDLLKALVSPGIPNSFNGIDLSELRIADIGTGSGAIGITSALELPKCHIDLIDIDDTALKLAKINVDLFTLNISVIKSDLLLNTASSYEILLCNLPYVPDDFNINLAAQHEPRLAIFGGPDGLDVYRRLFKQIDKLKVHPLYILIESMPPQQAFLRKIAEGSNYDQHQIDDFIQVFKLRNGSLL